MGEICALASAVVWAFAVILLRHSGARVSPFALNLFRVGFSVPLLLATLYLAGGHLRPAGSGRDAVILVASGVLGIMVADTLFHWSLNLIGAGITAIVDTCYSPLTVLLAYMFLGERLGPRDVTGMGMIISAVLLSATLEPPPGRSRRDLLLGILVGVVAILFLVLGIIIAKPVLNRTPLLWAVAVRQTGTLAVMLPVTLALPARRKILRVFRPDTSWRTMAPAACLGSYVALILWIAGMKYTLASVAAILNQSTTVFILILAVIFLKERLTPRKLLAGALALAGVLLVTLG